VRITMTWHHSRGSTTRHESPRVRWRLHRTRGDSKCHPAKEVPPRREETTKHRSRWAGLGLVRRGSLAHLCSNRPWTACNQHYGIYEERDHEQDRSTLPTDLNPALPSRRESQRGPNELRSHLPCDPDKKGD